MHDRWQRNQERCVLVRMVGKKKCSDSRSSLKSKRLGFSRYSQRIRSRYSYHDCCSRNDMIFCISWEWQVYIESSWEMHCWLRKSCYLFPRGSKLKLGLICRRACHAKFASCWNLVKPALGVTIVCNQLPSLWNFKRNRPFDQSWFHSLCGIVVLISERSSNVRYKWIGKNRSSETLLRSKKKKPESWPITMPKNK